MENDRLPGAPVLVIDNGPVLGGDGRHVWISFSTVGLEWRGPSGPPTSVNVEFQANQGRQRASLPASFWKPSKTLGLNSPVRWILTWALRFHIFLREKRQW